jgi:hypothetical protein
MKDGVKILSWFHSTSLGVLTTKEVVVLEYETTTSLATHKLVLALLP